PGPYRHPSAAAARTRPGPSSAHRRRISLLRAASRPAALATHQLLLCQICVQLFRFPHGGASSARSECFPPARQRAFSVRKLAPRRSFITNIKAMPEPVITLTTDFGEESPYVAAMKGVILGINPSARIIDLSHQIPPQNLSYAAFFLSGSIPYFPHDLLHIVVVDPGVGTERALLYVEVDG